jgi:hypothetical protein
MMKKFKIPRKLKKKLRKTIWLYPLNVETNTYLMATPYNNEKDYKAYKLGVLKDIMDR